MLHFFLASIVLIVLPKSIISDFLKKFDFFLDLNRSKILENVWFFWPQSFYSYCQNRLFRIFTTARETHIWQYSWGLKSKFSPKLFLKGPQNVFGVGHVMEVRLGYKQKRPRHPLPHLYALCAPLDGFLYCSVPRLLASLGLNTGHLLMVFYVTSPPFISVISVNFYTSLDGFLF